MKIGSSILIFIVSVGAVWAYEPPPGGANLFLYGHPKFITGANSVAGGPVFSEGSYSMNMNPALTAGLQSLSADLGYSGLQQTGGLNPAHNGALHLGISFPTRRGVLTAGIHGIFAKSDEVPFGNIGVLRLGFSRDVTENLYLGLSLSGGLLNFDETSAFYLAGDVGLWYRRPEIFFLKNVRFGLVMQNIGKSFDSSGAEGDTNVTGFPPILVPKIGAAASFIDVKNFVAGISADVAFPTFMNVMINTGLHIVIADLVYLSGTWDFNLREYLTWTDAMHLPSIGLGVKFSVNTSGSELMKKRGFNETTIDTGLAWQKLHQDVHHFSVGASASFGVKDVLPPDISIGEVRYTP